MQRLYPSDSGQHIYKEYPSRWIQLGLFIFALVSNIMFGFSLSPIVKEMSLIYDVDSRYRVCIDIRYLQFLTISFTIFSVIMIVPGNMLNEKYGVRTTIQLGIYYA